MNLGRLSLNFCRLSKNRTDLYTLAFSSYPKSNSMHIPNSILKPFALVLLGLFAFVIACSKDDAVEGEAQELAVDNEARLSAKQLYENYYQASATQTTDVPWVGSEPDCDAGSIPQSTKDKIFQRIFYFRQAVGLNNTLAENATKSIKAQHAALMMHANNQLEHFPPDGWKCFTQDGKDGAGSSLLTMAKNAEAITSYMRDQGANNGPVGHRRWLLWPRLQEIGIGNTDRANAIWVLGNPGSAPADAPEFVAWPPQGYIPDLMVFPRWSFSITDADFSAAKVIMTSLSGKNIPLTTEALSNAFGDRTIVWVPEDIDASVSEDTAYNVTIENVILNGESQDYEYQVILFDPES